MLQRSVISLLVAATLLIGSQESARAQDFKTDVTFEEEAASAGKRTSFVCESGLADRYPCSNVNLVAFVPKSELGAVPGIGLNDAWGWVDPLTGQRWALVGRTDGTAFVDITDPANPRYAGELPGPSNTRPSAWRDIKVDGNWAFVVADGNSQVGVHGMQVFDLTRLRGADGSPVSFTADARYTDFSVAHNVVVNEESNRAYAVGSRIDQHGCNAGLHIIDIADPSNPRFLGCFSDRGTGRAGMGYTHDAQCVTYRGPDLEHQGQEICVGSNETAISIVDVTEATAPKSLSRAAYPAASYIHQGWFSEDQRLFIQNDELDERVFDDHTHTYIWDVEDLDDPVLLTDFVSDVTSTDHNLYVRGDMVYQANYSSGLRVLDISAPAEPFVAGFFDTRPGDSGVNFNGAWTAWPYSDSDLVIISSRSEGLFVVRPSPLLGVRFADFQITGGTGYAEVSWRLVRQADVTGYQIVRHREDGRQEILLTLASLDTEGSATVSTGDGIFHLQVVAFSANGGRVESGLKTVNVIQGTHLFEAPWPNPVANSTQAMLAVSRGQRVRVSSHDALGRERTVLFNGFLGNDRQLGLDLDLSDWPAGVYYLRVAGQHFQESAPFTVVR